MIKRTQIYIKKFIKLLRALSLLDFKIFYAFIRFQTLPSLEHQEILKEYTARSYIDVGANKGQFALAILNIHPNAKLISIEPLDKPFNTLKKIFKNNINVKCIQSACGKSEKKLLMNISAKDDSSSFLEISSAQIEHFPGTHMVERRDIDVMPLDKLIQLEDIERPIFLKIDVQGFELEVLQGTNLNCIDYIYVESSMKELYKGQPLFNEVNNYLISRNFKLVNNFNSSYDNKNSIIQADFLYQKNDSYKC